MKFEPPQIPDTVEQFAVAVAALDKSHKIKSFTLKLQPDYPRGDDRRHSHGELSIIFTQTDGRGRPSENLTIELAADLRVELTKNPQSHD